MKRMRFLGVLLACLLPLGFMACSGDSDDGGDEKKSLTLTERLASAKDGDVIDIKAEGLVIDKSEYTISKSVSIKNGDLKDVSLKVDSGASSARAASSSASADIIVLFENLTGLKFLDVISAKNVQISSSKVESVVVSSDDASVSVTKVEVETLEIIADGVKMSVSSATVNTLKVDNDAEVALSGTTTVAKLTVKDDFIGYISKTETSEVSTAETVSGTDAKSIIAEVPELPEVSDTEIILNKEIEGGKIVSATYWNTVISTTPIVKWLKPDSQGVFTVHCYKTNSLWNTWGSTVLIERELVKGKNYKIQFKIKTSKNTVVNPQWRAIDSKWAGNYERNLHPVKTVAGEWTDVTLYTSKLLAAYPRIEILFPVESYKEELDLSFKDFSIEETTDAEAPVYATEYWAAGIDKGDSYIHELVDASCDADGIVTINIKKETGKHWPDLGMNVLACTLPRDYAGKIVEISYELYAENESDVFATSVDIGWTENVLPYSWAWATYFKMPAKTWITAKAYVPVFADMKDAFDYDQILKIWICDGIKNTIKVRNVKVTVCEDAPIEAWYSNIEPIWLNYKVGADYFDGIRIPAGETVQGRIQLNLKDTWEGSNVLTDGNILYMSTDCMTYDLANIPSGLEIAPVGNSAKLYLKNTTASDIYVNPSFNAKTGVVSLNKVEPKENGRYVYVAEENPKPTKILFLNKVHEDGSGSSFSSSKALKWNENNASLSFVYSKDKFSNDLNSASYAFELMASLDGCRYLTSYGAEGHLQVGKKVNTNQAGFIFIDDLTDGATYNLSLIWDDENKSVEVSLSEAETQTESTVKSDE